MGMLNMSRRSFLKLSAVTAAACAVAETGSAFADGVYQPQTASNVQRIRTACRGCGKMECGVWVTKTDGKVTRIEGDETAFQSRGNCCTKSQASIQAAYHPDRLLYPLKRTNPKGGDPGWQRISWDEAFEIISKNFKQNIEKYGGQSNFSMMGTSRPTAMTASAIGSNCLQTPNMYTAFEICKGPRYMASTLLDATDFFWMTVSLQTRVYVQWGTEVAYSNYDDSCRSAVDNATRASKHILVDPRMTPLGKEADYWLDLRPGTDLAIAMCWFHLLEQNDLYDNLFVKRWTDSPFLVCTDMEPTGGLLFDDMGGTDVKTHLLKESDLKEDGKYYRFMVWDSLANDGKGGLTYYDSVEGHWEGEELHYSTTGSTIDEVYPGAGSVYLPDETQFDPVKDPALYGEFEVTFKDGTKHTVKPVWQLYAERCNEFTPEHTEEVTGVAADTISDALFAYAKREDPRFGNGGIHLQLACDQTGNPVHTIRAIRWVAICLGNEDIPGGYRGETSAPVGVQAGDTLTASPAQPSSLDESKNWTGVKDLRPKSPEMTTWAMNTKGVSVQKYPLLRAKPLWTDADCLWDAILEGNPYPVNMGFAVEGNFMNQSNPAVGYEALQKLDFFGMADLWQTPMAQMADVLLPAAHWLECNTARRGQGSGGAFGANVKCIECPGEALEDCEIMEKFYKAMGVSFAKDIGYDGPEGDWPPYYPNYQNYQVKQLGMTWEEYVKKFQEHGWFSAYEALPETFGQFRRYEMGRKRRDELPGFPTPTGKVEIWSTILDTVLDDIDDAMPRYFEPKKGPVSTPELMDEYPFILTTGSRNPTFFHSEHRQLPWCREQWPVPRVEINPEDAKELGIEQGDWVWLETKSGKVRQVADLYYGINRGVANANHTWWYPELKGYKKGWDLSAINLLVDRNDGDTFTGTSTLRAYPVKIYKATPENSPFGNPVPCDDDGTEIITSPTDPRLKEWLPDYENGRE